MNEFFDNGEWEAFEESLKTASKEEMVWAQSLVDGTCKDTWALEYAKEYIEIKQAQKIFLETPALDQLDHYLKMLCHEYNWHNVLGHFGMRGECEELWRKGKTPCNTRFCKGFHFPNLYSFGYWDGTQSLSDNNILYLLGTEETIRFHREYFNECHLTVEELGDVPPRITSGLFKLLYTKTLFRLPPEKRKIYIEQGTIPLPSVEIAR